MWIKLDIDGIDFHFRIAGFRPSISNWEDEWSRVDLTLQSGTWLNFSIESDEILLNCEVEEMRDRLKALLENAHTQRTRVSFLEPVLTLVLNPEEELVDSNEDVHFHWEVILWNDAPTDNKIVLHFARDHIEKFLCYLRLITKQITLEELCMKKLINDGEIYGQLEKDPSNA